MAPIDAVVPQPSTSPRPPETPPGSSPCTPPNNIRVQGSPLVGTMDRFEQGMMKLIQALERVDTTTKLEDIESKPSNYTEAGKPKARASKIEYRRVDEVWDAVTSKYKIVKSAALPERVTDLDEHVFVVRARKDKQSFEQVFYIDIKSDMLRDVLKFVLRKVYGLSLREDEIIV